MTQCLDKHSSNRLKRLNRFSRFSTKTKMRNYGAFWKSKGQSSILGIAFGLMLVTGIYTLYNVSQTTTEKTRLVNAADAAAYSSGIYVARNLNYIAYTNRAMMANHIAIGHLTAYYSWVHYAEDLSGTLDAICSVLCHLIPYIGTLLQQYIDLADDVLEEAVEIAEDGVFGVLSAGDIAEYSDVVNNLYYGTQQVARAALNPISITAMQSKILDSYGNGIGLIDRVPTELATNAKLLSAFAVIPREWQAISTYVNSDSYTPGNDNGRIKGLVEDSVDYMAGERRDRWLRNGNSRDWRHDIGVPGLLTFRFEKYGYSEQTEEDDGSDTTLNWETADSFRLRRRFVGGKWSTIATVFGNEASTKDDLYDDYKGIENYLTEEDPLEDCFQPTFSSNFYDDEYDCHSVTVVASKGLGSDQGKNGSQIGGIKRQGDELHERANGSLYSVARAEVFFYRPRTMSSFGDGKAEYANLFNPFWKARLSD